MNKLTKGAIAGAAGIALLLGGAGTFALWNGSAQLGSASVATGKLTIAADSAAATWTDVSSTVVGGTSFDPATQRIVPGDVITFKKRITIDAVGKNLKATLGIDTTSISAQATGVSYDLSAAVVSGTGVGAVAANTVTTGPKTYTFTPGSAATTQVDVTVTITFDPATSGTTSQNATGIDLSGLKVYLNQVRP